MTEGISEDVLEKLRKLWEEKIELKLKPEPDVPHPNSYANHAHYPPMTPGQQFHPAAAMYPYSYQDFDPNQFAMRMPYPPYMG